MKKLGPFRGRSSKRAAFLYWPLTLLAPLALAQVRGATPSGGAAVLTSSGRATLGLDRPDPSDLLREIDDPSLGQRWLLYRDSRHPQGPGRLVAVGASAPAQLRASSSPPEIATAASRPVLRAGDPVILEESTPIVEARLEAIALAPACKGSPVKVRLLLGGKVLEAIAVAPGRVALAPHAESQP